MKCEEYDKYIFSYAVIRWEGYFRFLSLTISMKTKKYIFEFLMWDFYHPDFSGITEYYFECVAAIQDFTGLTKLNILIMETAIYCMCVER